MERRSIERNRSGDPGGRGAEPRHQAGGHRHLDRVGEADPEHPLGRRRVEVLALQHRRLDLGERHPHRIGKRERAGRRPHAFGAPGQQLVPEQRPEPREIVTHGRLAEPDAGSRARHAPLGEQRIEGDQQVQVEPA